MLYVVMKNGRVLIYNTANHLVTDVELGSWDLWTKKGGDWITTLNPDTVERVEVEKPCAVLHVNKKTGRY